MVAGSIEERIKKMKEAILSEANERASTIVKNADEEAANERAMLFNHEKEKIHHEFIALNKQEKVQEKMYPLWHAATSQPSTTGTASAEWKRATSMLKS
jgi:vacuolar-type H+-ATPase subunit H